ncbi:MAG: hypothetical protein ACI9LY_002934 [Arenicella sp.]|jgi:hypothetical protein
MIDTIKKRAKKIPLFMQFAKFVSSWHERKRFSSSNYWDSRYLNGGTSGAGSYAHLAEFKANVLNLFVADKKVETVIEFGFGDGNQLTLADYPDYIGYDVSQKAVEVCGERFMCDINKSFRLVSEWQGETAELVLSLDVIYHLIEDFVFEKYMNDLFAASSKYVVIYASNSDDNKDNQAMHVRHREFTRWVAEKAPEWSLQEQMPNQYPIEKYGDKGSFAGFYFYEKL